MLPKGSAELVADGNLHWSLAADAAAGGSAFLARVRDPETLAASRAAYPPGWAASDRFADPRFFHLDPRPGAPLDLRVTVASPAAGAGVPLPPDCPDPLGPAAASARPDAGAIPIGAEPWRVGVRGRFTMFGQLIGLTVPTSLTIRVSLTAEELRPWRPAALLGGHHDAHAQALAFALEQAHFAAEPQPPERLPVGDLARYAVIVCDGHPVPPGEKPPGLGKADLARLAQWLRGGGTLLLTGRSLAMFHGPGARFLSSLGLREVAADAPGGTPAVLQPDHPWVKHVQRKPAPSWLAAERLVHIACDGRENVIGDSSGRSVLCRVPAGKGQVVYQGWTTQPLADSRSPGSPSAPPASPPSATSRNRPGSSCASPRASPPSHYPPPRRTCHPEERSDEGSRPTRERHRAPRRRRGVRRRLGPPGATGSFPPLARSPRSRDRVAAAGAATPSG